MGDVKSVLKNRFKNGEEVLQHDFPCGSLLQIIGAHCAGLCQIAVLAFAYQRGGGGGVQQYVVFKIQFQAAPVHIVRSD